MQENEQDRLDLIWYKEYRRQVLKLDLFEPKKRKYTKPKKKNGKKQSFRK
jgi:hypothetical protein